MSPSIGRIVLYHFTQFQSRATFAAKHGPRVRVDALPDYVLEAGIGDP